jgi:zinc/manganese transport system substrate-binding protein
MRHIVAALAVCCTFAAPAAHAADGKIAVVAAENFYGDIGKQIGGDRVEVVSIISSPDQDPHLFETTPGIVRKIAAAQVVVYNGADYDTWMEKLLQAAPRAGRLTTNVAAATAHKAGDNPHLWYDPMVIRVVARGFQAAFGKIDRAHYEDYRARLAAFEASLTPIDDKIAAIRTKFAGTPITASEPVIGYMAAAIGLTMRNERFQTAIMNDTEPSARDVAAFEEDLKARNVRVMFYNKQAANKVVQHLVDLARASKVPVVGVTETEPPGLSYQEWMLSQLNDIEKALAETNP